MLQGSQYNFLGKQTPVRTPLPSAVAHDAFCTSCSKTLQSFPRVFGLADQQELDCSLPFERNTKSLKKI